MSDNASNDYITDAEQSIFKKASNGALVHPYQVARKVAGEGFMDIRKFKFDAPKFGQDNLVDITSVPMVVNEAYVEIQLAAEGTVTGAKWEPVPTWVSPSGVRLDYNGQNVYTMSEPECTSFSLLDEDHKNQQKKQDWYGYNQAANDADTAQFLYMPLGPIGEQCLSNVGPLDSYKSGRWQVNVGLKAANLCMSNSTTAETPDATIVKMSLILIGSRSSPVDTNQVREALKGAGLEFNFLRSYFERRDLVDNAGAATLYKQQYKQVGAASQLRLLVRNKATLNATTVSTKNNINYQIWDGVNDTLRVGTSSFPYAIWGQPMSLPIARIFYSAESLRNSPGFLSTAASPAMVNASVYCINFPDSANDLEFGTSNGSFMIDNDLEAEFNITTDLVQDDYLDSILYMHNKAVLKVDSFVSVTSN